MSPKDVFHPSCTFVLTIVFNERGIRGTVCEERQKTIVPARPKDANKTNDPAPVEVSTGER